MIVKVLSSQNYLNIVDPDAEYMLSTFTKALDTRKSDLIDSETIVNATSVQVCINMNGNKFLLCGDCSFSAIEDKVGEYKYIQLPHHGKRKQAVSSHPHPLNLHPSELNHGHAILI